MTNADKFLKDGVSAEEFAEFLKSKQPNNKYDMTFHDITWWLNAKATPTLTEDERVILKNVDKKYKYIGRGEMAEQLYLKDEKGFKHCLCLYKHLFQFIRNGEEYEIAELLKGE